MRIIVFALATVMVCTCALLGAELEPPEQKVTLTVNVVSGTRDGQGVTGDEVIVQVFHHEQMTAEARIQADSNGQALFENLPGGGHRIALVHAMHQDMRFGGSTVSLGSGAATVTTSVTVFDVSLDNSALSAGTHHLIVRPHGEFVVFTEYVQVTNPTDYAVSSSETDDADRPIVLRLALPNGYSNFDSSGYFVTDALGFAKDSIYDTMAMPPGSHQIIFSYAVRTTGEFLDATKKLTLPTKSLVLFSYLGPEEIEGLPEPDGELVSTDGKPAKYYSYANLPAGHEISFKVIGVEASSDSDNSWVVLPLIFAVIIVLAIMRLRPAKNQKGSDSSAVADSQTS